MTLGVAIWRCSVVLSRRLCTLLVFSISLLATGPAQAVQTPGAEDGYLQEFQQITTGVWVFSQPRFQVQPAGNVTLVEQSDGIVLIDAGGSPGAARRIVERIRALTDKPVKAVIITHWHGDHPLGLSEILRAWPQARTIATRTTQAHLRSPATMNAPAVFDAGADAAFQARIQGFAAYARRMAGEAPTPEEKAGWSGAERLFDRYARDVAGAITLSTKESFENRLDLPDDAAPVEVRFLGRANTDGDAVVWLPRQKVLVTGDVVVAPFPFGFGSFPAEWIATLNRLRTYDFHILVPGHGPPQKDHAYLDRLVAALADARARIAPMVAQGLGLEEIRARADFSTQIDDFAGQDPWLRRWVGEYWIKPIVASAYKEAKGAPIEQSLRGE